MMAILLVGLGGATGSLTRFYLGKWINERSKSHYPLGTFLINITGALLLGLVVTGVHSESMTWFVADGFLGAYTTFSTFLYEGYTLSQEGEPLSAVKYFLGSIATGILGFMLGSGLMAFF